MKIISCYSLYVGNKMFLPKSKIQNASRKAATPVGAMAASSFSSRCRRRLFFLLPLPPPTKLTVPALLPPSLITSRARQLPATLLTC